MIIKENYKFAYVDKLKDMKGKSISGVADFETCAIDNTNTGAKVWASGLMFLDDINTLYTGNSIDMFIEQLINIPYITTTLHFHNLGFDVLFLLSRLLELGYTKVNDVYKTNILGENRVKQRGKATEKSFEIIFAEGQYYCLKINWFAMEKIKRTKNKETHLYEEKKEYKMKTTIIYDSFKKVNSSLANIAKDFLGLPVEEQKGTIDYESIRPDNYKMTKLEKEYLFKDCNILAQLIIKLEEDFDFIKMTASSQAFYEFLKVRYKNETTTKNMDCFREEFPLLDVYEDNFCRLAYRGGWTYVNPAYKGDIKNLYGKTYDVNSLYPFSMYVNQFPYGEPAYYTGGYKKSYAKSGYTLYIQRIQVSLFELKEGMLPMIQIKNDNRFKGNEYLINNKVNGRYVPVTLTLSSVDLELFYKTYDVDNIKELDGYMFKAKEGIFNEYIDKFIEIKKTSKGAKRSFAKIMLNALYGKFASRCKKIDGNVSLENELLKIDVNPEHDGVIQFITDSFYTPVAVFITSYARKYTIEHAVANKDVFMYADTDSLHLHLKPDETPIGLKIDSEKTGDLGLWDLEKVFTDSKFLGQKRYMEYDGKWDIKCCGLGSDALEQIKTKDDFCYYTGKGNKGVFITKKKKRVKGGALILNTEYRLTEFAYLGKY